MRVQQSARYDTLGHIQFEPEQQPPVQAQATETAREPIQKQLRQFVLNGDSIKNLLDNPQFKNNITVGKVLKIIQALMEGNKATDVIAKQFEVEQAMVALIKACVNSKQE